MAILKLIKKMLFCPIKGSKPKKSSHQPNARNNNEIIQHDVNNHIIDNQHATSIPYRYVTTEFEAKAQDELTVLPGEVVFWHYPDNSNSGNWSYVSLCLSDRKDLTKKEGFVPSDILATEPERNLPCKKKLPRSTAHHPIEHSHLHRHTQHNSAQPSVHEEARFHQHQHVCEHQPGSFGIPHSLQGSSGKQSLIKYSDLRNFNPPAYTNLRAQISDVHYDDPPDVRPYVLRDYGVYIVIYNFIAREENDLNVKPGEIVFVRNKDDVDWFWVRREDGAEGFVPSGFICDHEHVKSILNKGNSTVTMKSSNHNDYHTYINHIPDRESLATDLQSTAFQHSLEINKLV